MIASAACDKAALVRRRHDPDLQRRWGIATFTLPDPPQPANRRCPVTHALDKSVHRGSAGLVRGKGSDPARFRGAPLSTAAGGRIVREN